LKKTFQDHGVQVSLKSVIQTVESKVTLYLWKYTFKFGWSFWHLFLQLFKEREI